MPLMDRVKDVLSYLQLLENSSFLPAFSRCCLRIPKVGEKTLQDILAVAREGDDLSTFQVCLRIAQGSTIVRVNSSQRTGIIKFTKMVTTLSQAAKEVSPGRI